MRKKALTTEEKDQLLFLINDHRQHIKDINNLLVKLIYKTNIKVNSDHALENLIQFHILRYAIFKTVADRQEGKIAIATTQHIKNNIPLSLCVPPDETEHKKTEELYKYMLETNNFIAPMAHLESTSALIVTCIEIIS